MASIYLDLAQPPIVMKKYNYQNPNMVQQANNFSVKKGTTTSYANGCTMNTQQLINVLQKLYTLNIISSADFPQLPPQVQVGAKSSTNFHEKVELSTGTKFLYDNGSIWKKIDNFDKVEPLTILYPENINGMATTLLALGKGSNYGWPINGIETSLVSINNDPELKAKISSRLYFINYFNYCFEKGKNNDGKYPSYSAYRQRINTQKIELQITLKSSLYDISYSSFQSAIINIRNMALSKTILTRTITYEEFKELFSDNGYKITIENENLDLNFNTTYKINVEVLFSTNNTIISNYAPITIIPATIQTKRQSEANSPLMEFTSFNYYPVWYKLQKEEQWKELNTKNLNAESIYFNKIPLIPQYINTESRTSSHISFTCFPPLTSQQDTNCWILRPAQFSANAPGTGIYVTSTNIPKATSFDQTSVLIIPTKLFAKPGVMRYKISMKHTLLNERYRPADSEDANYLKQWFCVKPLCKIPKITLTQGQTLDAKLTELIHGSNGFIQAAYCAAKNLNMLGFQDDYRWTSGLILFNESEAAYSYDTNYFIKTSNSKYWFTYKYKDQKDQEQTPIIPIAPNTNASQIGADNLNKPSSSYRIGNLLTINEEHYYYSSDFNLNDENSAKSIVYSAGILKEDKDNVYNDNQMSIINQASIASLTASFELLDNCDYLAVWFLANGVNIIEDSKQGIQDLLNTIKIVPESQSEIIDYEIPRDQRLVLYKSFINLPEPKQYEGKIMLNNGAIEDWKNDYRLSKTDSLLHILNENTTKKLNAPSNSNTIHVKLKINNNETAGNINIKLAKGNTATDNDWSFNIVRWSLTRSDTGFIKTNFTTIAAIDEHLLSWEKEKEIIDYTCEEGILYKYGLQPFKYEKLSTGKWSETAQVRQIIEQEDYIVSSFEHMMLIDEDDSLIIKYNPKVSTFKTNLQVNKTEMLGNQFPVIRQNGNVEYKQFALSGLLSIEADILIANTNLITNINNVNINNRLQTWANQDFYIENDQVMLERIYKNKVLDWLNNGKPKLLKTATEGNFIVQLMNVQLTPMDQLGRRLHSFSCEAYEVAKLDNYDLTPFIRVSSI